jgi:large subunit ribosomal protein L9
MKVLLTKDVPGLGKAGETAQVADGYGRNYLIPNEMAVLARPGLVRQAKERQRAQERRAARQAADARALAQKIETLSLNFQAKAGEQDKLYGSITSGDIAEQLEARLGQKFDRRKVLLEDPIRQLGTHQVEIKLAADVTGTVTVVVEREE